VTNIINNNNINNYFIQPSGVVKKAAADGVKTQTPKQISKKRAGSARPQTEKLQSTEIVVTQPKLQRKESPKPQGVAKIPKPLD